jgi:transposase
LARYRSAGTKDQLRAHLLTVLPGVVGLFSELDAATSRAAPGVTGVAGQALAGVTRAYLAALDIVMAQIEALEAQIAAVFQAYLDAAIFTSLPRTGTLRAARLLAEIGDCRSRFPTAASQAGLARVTPVDPAIPRRREPEASARVIDSPSVKAAAGQQRRTLRRARVATL